MTVNIYKACGLKIINYTFEKYEGRLKFCLVGGMSLFVLALSAPLIIILFF